MRRARKGLLIVVANLIVAALLLAAAEGLASILLVARDLASGSPQMAERLHTEYDPDLGWVNRPLVAIEDMYGPGRAVRTNSQRLRSDRNFGISVPVGKVRVICSGDSFTFGYGVDNQQAWCQLLASRDKRLETVNMGQGGYGLDQSYLWYKRDGLVLQHDIQILAFITNDFSRMQDNQFLGYGKPVIYLANDELTVSNVPVPRRPKALTAMTRDFISVENLSLVRLLRRLFFQPPGPTDQDRVRAVVSRIIKDLQRIHRDRGSLLVLVHLPEQQDRTGDYSAAWRAFLGEEAASQGIPYIDLVEDFRQLTVAQADGMFIPSGALDYLGAAGHYTEKGNAFVADLLVHRLLGIAEVQSRLNSRSLGN